MSRSRSREASDGIETDDDNDGDDGTGNNMINHARYRDRMRAHKKRSRFQRTGGGGGGGDGGGGDGGGDMTRVRRGGALSRMADAHRDDLLASWMRLIPLISETIDRNDEKRAVMYEIFGRPPYYFLGTNHAIVPAWAHRHDAMQPIGQSRNSIRIAPHFNGCFRNDYSERTGCRPGGYYVFMRVRDVGRDSVALAIMQAAEEELGGGGASTAYAFLYTKFVRRKALRENRTWLQTQVQGTVADSARHEILIGMSISHESDIISVGDQLYVESHMADDEGSGFYLNIVRARARMAEERYVICTVSTRAAA